MHASAPFNLLVVQNGEPTPAQCNATRFGTICAVQCVGSPVLRNAPVPLPTGKMSQPMQWSQVVHHTGHPDRAAARMRGHLGNLGSTSAPHGGAGGKSIIIFTRAELECSLERCLTAVCNHHLFSVSVSEFVLFFKIGPRNLIYSARLEKIACAHK